MKRVLKKLAIGEMPIWKNSCKTVNLKEFYVSVVAQDVEYSVEEEEAMFWKALECTKLNRLIEAIPEDVKESDYTVYSTWHDWIVVQFGPDIKFTAKASIYITNELETYT